MIKAIAAAFLLFAAGETTEPTESAPESPESEISVVSEETPEQTETEPKTDTQVVYYVPVEEEPKDFGEWIKSIFTPEVIASIVTALTAAAALLKLASSAKVFAKSKKKDEAEIMDQVERGIKAGVEKAMKEVIAPLEEKVQRISPALDTFSKVLALSHDNSPEAKLAILDLLQKIGGKETKEIAQTAKAEVVKQAEESKAKTEKAIAQLDEIIEYDGTRI